METKRELFQTLVKRFGLLNRKCCEVGSLDITMVQSQILYEISKLTAERKRMHWKHAASLVRASINWWIPAASTTPFHVQHAEKIGEAICSERHWLHHCQCGKSAGFFLPQRNPHEHRPANRIR